MGERLCTLGAGVRRFDSVNCLVTCQFALMGERFVTTSEGEKPLSSVGQVV